MFFLFDTSKTEKQIGQGWQIDLRDAIKQLEQMWSQNDLSIGFENSSHLFEDRLASKNKEENNICSIPFCQHATTKDQRQLDFDSENR